jgi:lipopolysaccharide/colanic/teichoic acid biosynthesis glycosyltransferase
MNGRVSAPRRRPESRTKRLLDVVAAGSGLLVTMPILAVAAAAIRWSMGRGVLFKQRRPGRHGETFTLYKLRTMADPVDAEGRPRPEYSRVTPLGRILRTTSIDELPQLWNVLRGDMSLVGPRPLLLRYMGRYSPEQRRRHDVRPGITGWAQVHRRTAVTWDEKLRLDVWYVDHRTMALDLWILIKTIGDLASRRGSPAMDSLSQTSDNELEFKGSTAPRSRAMRIQSEEQS